MGTYCNLHRLTSAEIEQLIADPSSMNTMLGFDKGPRMREVRPKGILGFLLRLTPVSIHEEDPSTTEADFDIDPEKHVDVDKAWHGLHFLFTGTADGGRAPACYLTEGGEDLDDEGSGRALRPKQVKVFAEYLDELTPEILTRRYDPQRMMELDIYPGGWENDPSGDFNPLQWLLDYFADIQDFVKKAAAAGDGLVIHVS